MKLLRTFGKPFRRLGKKLLDLIQKPPSHDIALLANERGGGKLLLILALGAVAAIGLRLLGIPSRPPEGSLYAHERPRYIDHQFYSSTVQKMLKEGALREDLEPWLAIGSEADKELKAHLPHFAEWQRQNPPDDETASLIDRQVDFLMSKEDEINKTRQCLEDGKFKVFVHHSPLLHELITMHRNYLRWLLDEESPTKTRLAATKGDYDDGETDDKNGWMRAVLEGQKTFMLSGTHYEVERGVNRLPTPYRERFSWRGKLSFLDQIGRLHARETSANEPRLGAQIRMRRGDATDFFCQTVQPVNERPPIAQAALGRSIGDATYGAAAKAAAPIFDLKDEEGATLCLLYALNSPAGPEIRLINRVEQRVRMEPNDWERLPRSEGIIEYRARARVSGVIHYRSVGPTSERENITIHLCTAEEACQTPFVPHGNATRNRQVIASVHYHNGRALRQRAGALALLPGAPSVARLDAAIDTAMGMSGVDTALRDASFHYTLVPELQTQLQATIESRQIYDRARTRSGEREYGVTVMNEHGEVLALASAIRREYLRQPDNDRAMNINLRHHPVGSSGKPYFCAAAVATRPDLLDLAVKDGEVKGDPKNGDATTFISPINLWIPYFEHHHDPGSMNNQNVYAFYHSSNLWFAEQALLAVALTDANGKPLTDWSFQNSTPGAFQIGAQSMPPVNVPLMRFQNKRWVFPQGIADTKFARNFSEIFSIPLNPPAEGDYGTYNAEDTYAELCSILPSAAEWLSRERCAPQFGQQYLITPNIDLRNDFISMIVGGGRFGSWTNIELAQCLTRLITGRQVTATMLRKAPADGSPPHRLNSASVPGLRLDVNSLDRIRALLRKPVEKESGTAHKIHSWSSDRPAPYADLDIFAKTGTYPNHNHKTGNFRMLQFYIKPRNGAWDGPGLAVVVSVDGDPSVADTRAESPAVKLAREAILPIVSRWFRFYAAESGATLHPTTSAN